MTTAITSAIRIQEFRIAKKKKAKTKCDNFPVTFRVQIEESTDQRLAPGIRFFIPFFFLITANSGQCFPSSLTMPPTPTQTFF